METLLKYVVDKETVGRWKVDKSHESEVRIELYMMTYCTMRSTAYQNSLW